MLNFRHFKHAVTGPAEGLISCAAPISTGDLRVYNLAAEFPEHWDNSLLEVMYTGAAGAVIELSSVGMATGRAELAPNRPFRFMSKGRKYLRVKFSGSAGADDRFRLSVVSRSLIGDLPDARGFVRTFGYQPTTYLHADAMLPLGTGGTPTPTEVGIPINGTPQPIPPVFASSWLGRRALDFSGNKALRIDALAGVITNTSNPVTVIFAVILPATAATRCLIDFQSTALPSSRYWDLFVGPTDVTTLYLQSLSGLVTQDAAMLPSGSEGVPLIIGVTKHTATWDMCVLSAAGAADLAAGAAHTGAGAVGFDRATIGAEYDGTTYGSFANFQLRAFGMWRGTDIPIERLRAGLRLFRDGLDCPLV